jgi:hypothetical protein
MPLDGDNDLAPRKVSMPLFVWALGFIVGMMGVGFQWTFVQVADSQRKVAAAEARVEALNQMIAPLNYSLGQIQVDINWIKQTLLATDSTRRR